MFGPFSNRALIKQSFEKTGSCYKSINGSDTWPLLLEGILLANLRQQVQKTEHRCEFKVGLLAVYCWQVELGAGEDVSKLGQRQERRRHWCNSTFALLLGQVEAYS